MAAHNDYSQFSAAADSEALYKSMKGFGTDDESLINIITGRPREYLIHKVKPVYHGNYKKTLDDDIKGDTSGHYEDVLIAWITDRIAYMAQLVRKAVKGLGTNERILTELLCTQNNETIKAIKVSFAHQFGNSMDTAVLDDLSGDVKNLFAVILKASRPEGPADPVLAKADAESFYKHGEGKVGTDEEFFVKIIGERSRAHLELVNQVYANTYGNSLLKAIKNETSGHFKAALEALITPPAEYFAEKVRKAVAGSGTDEEALIRFFCSLSTAELKAANAFYTHKYGSTFKKDVANDVSGNFGKVLVKIIPDL
jgi:hypothetical protein